MSRNDLFFKILFTVELMLLPLVIFADLFLPTWAICLFIAGVLVAKVWLEVFKEKFNLKHKIISSIGNIAIFSVLLFFFASKGIIAMWLAVVITILIVLHSIFGVVLHKKSMPEMVDAIDYCFAMFLILALVAFTFAFFNATITTIALYAIFLSAAVSVAYKVYYCIKFKLFFRK